jgi:hypothetical protein
MAITNAQQYQQLVKKDANGKRPGYRGDAAYRSASLQSTGSQRGTATRSELGDDKPGRNEPSLRNDPQTPTVVKKDIKTRDRQEQIEREKVRARLKEEERRRKAEENRKRMAEELSNLGKSKTDKFGNVVKGIFESSPFSIIGDKFFKPLLEKGQKINDAFYEENKDIISKKSGIKNQKDYFTARLEGKIDAYGNPIGDSYRDSQGNIVTRGGGPRS